MPMSAICAPGGAAPAAPRGGFSTFDYNQAAHPALALIGPAPAGAPNGLCLALTMLWLKNWRDERHPYNQYIGNGGAGNPHLLNYMVAIFGGMGGPAAWAAQTETFMTMPVAAGGLGFNTVNGGLAVGPRWLGIVQDLRQLLATARFSILVVANAAGGTHAVGIVRSNRSVYFFDCNQGEVFLRDSDDFVDWFRAYKNPGFGYGGVAGPQIWNFRYN